MPGQVGDLAGPTERFDALGADVAHGLGRVAKGADAVGRLAVGLENLRDRVERIGRIHDRDATVPPSRPGPPSFSCCAARRRCDWFAVARHEKRYLEYIAKPKTTLLFLLGRARRCTRPVLPSGGGSSSRSRSACRRRVPHAAARPVRARPGELPARPRPVHRRLRCTHAATTRRGLTLGRRRSLALVSLRACRCYRARSHQDPTLRCLCSSTWAVIGAMLVASALPGAMARDRRRRHVRRSATRSWRATASCADPPRSPRDDGRRTTPRWRCSWCRWRGSVSGTRLAVQFAAPGATADRRGDAPSDRERGDDDRPS